MPCSIPTPNLVLPDNSSPGVLPVYFEGRLEAFVRRIGVVDLVLEAPSCAEMPVEGVIGFRGAMAVILPGPAVVRLAFPFRVEKLPSDAANYWRDLQAPRVQFELPL